MQRIAVQNVEIKQGMGKNGRAWTKYTVIGQDGSKASTFDEKASSIQPGDILQAEIELDGNYTNIKSFEVVGIGGQPAPAQPAQKPQPQIEQPKQGKEAENEYWERKQAIERQSIERQVAVKIAFEHGKGMYQESSTTEILQQAEQIYQWIHTGKLPNALVEKAKELAAIEDARKVPNGSNDAEHFENVGAMFAKAALDGITRTEILKHFKIAEKDAAKIAPDDLWPQILTEMILPARELAKSMK